MADKPKGIGRPKQFEELAKLNFHIPPDVKKKFRSITRKKGVPMSYVLREFVEAYVEKHSDPKDRYGPPA